MQLRHRKIQTVKAIRTKTLAGLLAAGLVFTTPLSALAAEDVSALTAQAQEEGAVQAEEFQQAQETDGSGERIDEFPEVSEDTDDTSDPEMPDEEGDIQADPEQPETPGEETDTDTSGNDGAGDAPGDQPEDADAEEAPRSNEELVAAQQIVKLPEIEEDFRFWTVARKYAFAKEALYIREEIPEEADPAADGELLSQNTDENTEEDMAAAKKEAKRLKESYISMLSSTGERKIESNCGSAAEILTGQARMVGSLEKNGLLYILKEEDNGWLYVESGNVRGFVKASEVYAGDAAQEFLKVYQLEANRAARKAGEKYDGIEGTAKVAEELIAPSENEAYTYLRATVSQTVVEKEYALASDKVGDSLLGIREEGSTEGRIVGTMKRGDLCYILADADADWIYVESGDVRGFVDAEYLDIGEETDKQVEEIGEDAFGLAEETVEPEENRALYYTLTSVKEGAPGGEIRRSLLEYAAQFIGNPYVWGGTSLTNGADCSGFAQQIYKAYGYDLPRVSKAQSQYGTKIAVEDAAPGDLIFYARNGSVYHVVIYAGDGRTIEAANKRKGIIQGTVNTRDAVWAVRVLD